MKLSICLKKGAISAPYEATVKLAKLKDHEICSRFLEKEKPNSQVLHSRIKETDT